LGSYVLSHRINGGSADTSTTEVGETIHPMAVAEAHANELPKLNSIAPFNDIVISNSIEYNEMVEHLGWSIGAGPYNTFQKTEGTMDLLAQQILATI